jgi:hypothetical protein
MEKSLRGDGKRYRGYGKELQYRVDAKELAGRWKRA